MRNKIKISLKSLIFITILFLILAFFYPVFDSPFKIIFFDVGEGDATFISSEGGGILIDGGPSPYLLRKKLRKFNIRKVDYIVLSHPHEDHIAGLSLFYQDPRVKKVITAPYPDSLKWEELKRCFGRRVEEINSEKEYKLGNLVMRFKFVNVPGEESNDEQLILKVKYRDLNILFTGDAGRGVQEELMKEKWIASHILKVPHHGSSDFEPKFIHKVAPFLAIISVGRKNRYHHPSSKVLTELRGVKIFRTDKNGDILLEGEKGRIRVFTSN